MKKNNQLHIKKNIRLLVIITFLISISQNVLGLQNHTVTATSFSQFKGKVIDSNTHKPLASINISIEGTNINTITNKEGEFLLKVSNDIVNKNIKISLYEYISKSIPLRDLKEDENIISLNIFATELAKINIDALRNAEKIS